jgi:IS605 OrfB family transposase
VKIISLAIATESFDELRRIQSAVIRSSYELAQENLTPRAIEIKLANKFDDKIDGFLFRCGVKKGVDIFTAQKKEGIIFGSRKAFAKRAKGELSKEDWKRLRTQPLYSIGQAVNKGNRRLRLTDTELVYTDSTQIIRCTLPKLKSNWSKILKELIILSNAKLIPLTYSIADGFVHICYDETRLKVFKDKYPKYTPKRWRCLGIDMNPNGIGISIWDRNTKSIIHVETLMYRNEEGTINARHELVKELEAQTINASVYETKKINREIRRLRDTPIVTGRKSKHEVSMIADYIAKLCRHYQVERIAVEDLSIKAKNPRKGKKFNRLVNNLWHRNFLSAKLHLIANIMGIKCVEVNPAYSSFVGNLQHPQLPDAAAAATEIARRGITLYEKGIFYPVLIKKEALVHRWKEMADVEYGNWIELFTEFKSRHLGWRSRGEAVTSSRFMSRRSKVWRSVSRVSVSN